MQALRSRAALALLLTLAGCSGAVEADHEHAHTAPRGGLLVELADHEAHAELLFDADAGRVTLYLLDGHAENPLRSAQAAIDLQLDALGDAGAPLTLPLLPVASDLSGETAGDTSRFEAEASALAGAAAFSGRIARVELRGASYADVPFTWPPEAAHDHDDGHDHGHDHDDDHDDGHDH